MSPILFGGSENRDESRCRRPVEGNVCKAAYNTLKAYDDCYHRAILLLEHRRGGPRLTRSRWRSEIIRHIEGDDVGDRITEGGVRVGYVGWRRGNLKGHAQGAEFEITHGQ
jgi:hypothetical protein